MASIPGDAGSAADVSDEEPTGLGFPPVPGPRVEVPAPPTAAPAPELLPSAHVRPPSDASGDRGGPLSFAPGAMIGAYRILEHIGRGGMGEVYAARDTVLGRKVAIKVVQRELVADPTSRARFLFEAQTTARFSHPHIVGVYGIGEVDGQPYVVLEYLEGRSLRQRFADGKLGLADALRIGAAIADALAEAHARGVLHRDLKPENVVIPKDGRLRVVDFGLAKRVPVPGAAEPSSALLAIPPAETAEGIVRGTPHYMAPENWTRRPPTPATDVWALGVMLFEMVAGRRPYERKGRGLDLFAIEVASPTAAPPLPRECEAPPPLATLVARCLEKDPARRPSARECAEQLKSLHQSLRSAPAPVESPFRGLRSFDERHAHLYFGRDAEIAAFVETLADAPVLSVVGPSGAGKSSFVHAGVVPRLRERGDWVVISLRPGGQPFRTLAARILAGDTHSESSAGARLRRPSSNLAEGAELALARLLAERPDTLALRLEELAAQHGAPVLLVVDQLEELHTMVKNPDVRAGFMRALASLADDRRGVVRAITTLRDDFLGALAFSAEAERALGRITVLRAPDRQGLVEMLTRPLELVGASFDDPGVPEAIVAELLGEPTSLPLLEFLADLLWHHRDRADQRLLGRIYRELGGVAGALAAHADGVVAGLPSAELAAARQLLLRLVTEELTRRVVPKPELVAGLGPEAERVIERLVEARLLVTRRIEATDVTSVELVHEALIRNWRRLARWIEEGKEETRFLAEVTPAAELWARRGRRDDELWQGAPLAEALEAFERLGRPGRDPVPAFLAAGRRRRERWARRRRGLLAAGAVALGLLAVVLYAQKEAAVAERRLAERRWAETEREAAENAIAREDLVEARARLRGSLEREDSLESRAIWERLAASELLWKKVVPTCYEALLLADGRRVAAACSDATVKLIDVDTLAVEPLRGHHDQVVRVARTRDGRQLLSAAWGGGELFLWDIERGGPPRALSGHEGRVMDLAFSPDGRLAASSDAYGVVRIWRLPEGVEERTIRQTKGGLSFVRFAPDGRAMVFGPWGETGIAVYDLEAQRIARTIECGEECGRSGDFTSDGRHLVTAGGRSIFVFDFATGARRASWVAHDATIHRIGLSPDGSRVASGSVDGTVRVFEVATGALLRVLSRHTAMTRGPTFVDDERLLSTSNDGTIRFWDLSKRERKMESAAHSAQVYAVAVSLDGRTIATGSVDHDIRLWDAESGRSTRVLSGHGGTVDAVAFDPSGRVLVSTSQDHTARIWDVASGRTLATLTGPSASIPVLALSPSGATIVTAASDHVLRAYAAEDGRLVGQLATGADALEAAVFLDEGTILASVAAGQILRYRFDGRELRLVERREGHRSLLADLALSRDRTRLASVSHDGVVKVWELPSWRSRDLAQLGARVYAAEFDPSGRYLATASSDGVARLFDLESGQALPLLGHTKEVNEVAFDPAGRWLATVSDDGTVRTWSVPGGEPRWRTRTFVSHPAEVSSAVGTTRIDGRAPEAGRAGRAELAAAELASSSPSGAVLCVVARGALHLLKGEERREVPMPEVEALSASEEGCFVASPRGLELVRRSGAPTRLLERPDRLISDGLHHFAALGDRLHAFDADGRPLRTLARPEGATAVLWTERHVFFGFPEGTILRLDAGATPSPLADAPPLAFEETPAAPVTRLVAGPNGMVLASFANGLVGAWDPGRGALLTSLRLHGDVPHLSVEGQTLYAASTLGGAGALDLSTYGRDRCALLEEVWARVPVVWEEGRAVRRAPPDDHPCRRRASAD